MIKKRSRTEAIQRFVRQPLSKREKQVLIELGEGRGTKEISAALGISANTVQVYADRLKKKLEAKTYNQLIRAAVLLREGILPNDSKGERKSMRVCPRCSKLFSPPDAKKEAVALGGYRALVAVLGAK